MMAEQATHANERDYVGVATPTLVYVIVPDRAKFDKIGAPCANHPEKQLLTKRVGDHGADEVTVIFQHWERR